MDKVNFVIGFVLLLLGIIQVALQADVMQGRSSPNYNVGNGNGGNVYPYLAEGNNQIKPYGSGSKFKVDPGADEFIFDHKNVEMKWTDENKQKILDDFMKYRMDTFLQHSENSRVGAAYQLVIALAGLFVAVLGLLTLVKTILGRSAPDLSTFAWVALTFAILSGALSMYDVDNTVYGPSKAVLDAYNTKAPTFNEQAVYRARSEALERRICYDVKIKLPTSGSFPFPIGFVATFGDGSTNNGPSFDPPPFIYSSAAKFNVLSAFDSYPSLFDNARCAPSHIYVAINAFSILNLLVMLLVCVFWTCGKSTTNNVAVQPADSKPADSKPTTGPLPPLTK